MIYCNYNELEETTTLVKTTVLKTFILLLVGKEACVRPLVTGDATKTRPKGICCLPRCDAVPDSVPPHRSLQGCHTCSIKGCDECELQLITIVLKMAPISTQPAIK